MLLKVFLFHKLSIHAAHNWFDKWFPVQWKVVKFSPSSRFLACWLACRPCKGNSCFFSCRHLAWTNSATSIVQSGSLFRGAAIYLGSLLPELCTKFYISFISLPILTLHFIFNNHMRLLASNSLVSEQPWGLYLKSVDQSTGVLWGATQLVTTVTSCYL